MHQATLCYCVISQHPPVYETFCYSAYCDNTLLLGAYETILLLLGVEQSTVTDVFAERVRNKSMEINPGSSWDSNPRPSEY